MKSFAIRPFCVVFALFAGFCTVAQQKTDTVPQIVQPIVSKAAGEVKNITEHAGKETVNALGQDFDSLLNIKSIISPFTSKIDLFGKGRMIRLGDAALSAGYNYFGDSTGTATGVYKDLAGIYSYEAGVTATIMNLPFNFSVQGNNGLYSFYNTPVDNFTQFNFDHRRYIEKLQSVVQQKISPDLILASALGRIQKIRAGYETMLKKEIEAIQADYYKEFQKSLSLPDDISNLQVQDVQALKNRVFSSIDANGISDDAARYQELLKNSGGSTGQDSIKNVLRSHLQKKESLARVYEKIISWKNRFDDNKAVKELRSHLPFTPENYKSFLTKPGKLQEIVSQYGNISSLQKLFMNITKLDIGQNALSEGDMSLENIVNSGVNTRFQNKRASVGFVYGKNNNVNNWLQSGLSSFATNEYSNLSGFRIGGGSGSLSDQWISLNLFEFNNTPDASGRNGLLQSAYLPMGMRKDAVVTVHSGMPIADKHKVTLDLSRSFGQYANSLSPDSIPVKTGPFGGDKQKENYAIGIGYTGEIIGTAVQVNLRKTGLGYNNPGNIFLRRGESMGGLSMWRKFFKKKLTLKYSTEYRNQSFDPEKLYRFITTTNKAQAGWRFHRNTRVNLSWQHSNYRSENPAMPETNGVNTRLQADGGYRIKLWKKWIQSNATVAQQRIDIPSFDSSNYKSRSWLMTHTQTIALNKNMLTFIMMANISDNKDYYFNTSFYTAESNYMYAAGQKLRMGSGLGYYVNSGWNQQLGIKQQVSVQLMKKLGVDIDAGYKKAVKVIRPELSNQFFGTASVHYQF